MELFIEFIEFQASLSANLNTNKESKAIANKDFVLYKVHLYLCVVLCIFGNLLCGREGSQGEQRSLEIHAEGKECPLEE